MEGGREFSSTSVVFALAHSKKMKLLWDEDLRNLGP